MFHRMRIDKYNLYGSDGCHLCEQALTLCLTIIDRHHLNEIDIIDQVSVAHETKPLAELYGIYIPVLENLTNNEKLFWPFTYEQVKALHSTKKKN